MDFRTLMKLPKVICSSVIRSAHKGESHGGVYIVNLERGTHQKVLDWDKSDISWEGRGGDRGLRGIAIHKEKIFLVGSKRLLVYNKKFKKLAEFRNQYLNSCHETYLDDNKLHISSTGTDSILVCDIDKSKFTKGYHLSVTFQKIKFQSLRILKKKGLNLLNYFSLKPRVKEFDPNTDNGPEKKDTLHLNNVFLKDNKLFFSGTRMNGLYYLEKGRTYRYAKLPFGTHNSTPLEKGVIFNSTDNHSIVYRDFEKKTEKIFSVKKFDKKDMLNTDLPKDHARQRFARGLIVRGDLIIGGSSPATVSVYSIKKGKRIKSVTLSRDIRNAIHGLEIWPF